MEHQTHTTQTMAAPAELATTARIWAEHAHTLHFHCHWGIFDDGDDVVFFVNGHADKIPELCRALLAADLDVVAQGCYPGGDDPEDPAYTVALVIRPGASPSAALTPRARIEQQVITVWASLFQVDAAAYFNLQNAIASCPPPVQAP